MKIQDIIDKFDKEFPELNELITANPYSSYSRKNDVKQFLKDSLTSMLDKIEKELPAKIDGGYGDEKLELVVITHNHLRQEVINIINSHK